ncbi:MAG: hypothetical protein K9K37_07340 [Desulfocapsa sp.]|nr:hypothetical protein [Desulfocapsa sp.]
MHTTPAMEQVNSRARTKASANGEISKVSVAVIVVSAGIIGCWATACLFAGTINSGGPLALAQNLINSILG